MKRFRRGIARTRATLHREVHDPAIDMVGAGVIGLYAGRTVVNTVLTVSAVKIGAPILVGLMVGLLAYDAYVHFHVLAMLERLMVHTVVGELLAI